MIRGSDSSHERSLSTGLVPQELSDRTVTMGIAHPNPGQGCRPIRHRFRHPPEAPDTRLREPRHRSSGRIFPPQRDLCPIPGRILAKVVRSQQYRRVRERPSSHDDLVDHLVRSTPLQRGEAVRVVLDVLAYFDETTDEFVRRRHRELQSGGLANAEIFERIAAELPHRAVAPPELSLRQLRRVVYG